MSDSEKWFERECLSQFFDIHERLTRMVEIVTPDLAVNVKEVENAEV